MAMASAMAVCNCFSFSSLFLSLALSSHAVGRSVIERGAVRCEYGGVVRDGCESAEGQRCFVLCAFPMRSVCGGYCQGRGRGRGGHPRSEILGGHAAAAKAA